VPVDSYRETWDRLAQGEELGGGIFAAKLPDIYIGVVLDFKDKNGKIKTVSPDSPAEKAGLRVDDVITQVDGKKITNQQELSNILMNRKANDEITLEVLRGENSLSIKLELENVGGSSWKVACAVSIRLCALSDPCSSPLASWSGPC